MVELCLVPPPGNAALGGKILARALMVEKRRGTSERTNVFFSDWTPRLNIEIKSRAKFELGKTFLSTAFVKPLVSNFIAMEFEKNPHGSGSRRWKTNEKKYCKSLEVMSFWEDFC